MRKIIINADSIASIQAARKAVTQARAMIPPLEKRLVEYENEIEKTEASILELEGLEADTANTAPATLVSQQEKLATAKAALATLNKAHETVADDLAQARLEHSDSQRRVRDSRIDCANTTWQTLMKNAKKSATDPSKCAFDSDLIAQTWALYVIGRYKPDIARQHPAKAFWAFCDEYFAHDADLVLPKLQAEFDAAIV